MPLTIYSTNNSGGRWWLSQEDWDNLIKAGWTPIHFKGWVRGAWRALCEEAAKAEFDNVTSQFSDELGCECCGPPHNFSECETLEGEESFPKDYDGELHFPVKGGGLMPPNIPFDR